MTNVNLLLFDNFETLDLFGPIEVLGQIDTFKLNYYSLDGGIIQSRQGTYIVTNKIEDADKTGILLIPGGQGTRTMINNERFISTLAESVTTASYCLSICTGSALLAKTGKLKGYKATSNKKAFQWVEGIDKEVRWIRKSRWVTDGKFYTSSGVSAGIDMTLSFIADLFGKEKALDIASHIEYIWNSDSNNDPFFSNSI